MNSHRKFAEKELASLKEKGWTITLSHDGKQKVYDPSGRYRFTVHYSPSDRRYPKNLRASIRRFEREYENTL